MRNPFDKIPIELFQEGAQKYPSVAKLFEKRIKRLVNRGLAFFDLPRIYQWMIIGGCIAQQKLSTLDKALEFLNGKNPTLDRKIREIAKLESDPEMFHLLTELLVIHRVLRSNVNNFEYEEQLQGSQTKFDINVDFEGQRIRIDVTHKEDIYPLEDTAEKIRINLCYINPSCGGDIQYAAPVQQNYHDGTVTISRDMTESELRQTIQNALNTMSSLKSESVKIPCPNPFFQITIDPNSTAWTGGSGGTRYSPDIDSYLRSIQKKAEKSRRIADASYKIIAVDFIPGSVFHDESYYREQLRQRLLRCELETSSSLDEIVTFSMRFENGKFENLKLLWKRETSSPPIFNRLSN